MDHLHFSLRISTSEKNYDKVSELLGIQINDCSGGWIYSISSKSEENLDFINVFLDLLEGKYEFLTKHGIYRESISIWMIYGYQDQCNLEFNPIDLKRLGQNNIALCISCYKIGR